MESHRHEQSVSCADLQVDAVLHRQKFFTGALNCNQLVLRDAAR